METDYFDIVASVQQGDTLAPYLFIICLDSVPRTSIDIIKDNGLKLAKERRKRYSAQTIPDADYADDIALKHILERAAAGIGIYVNADKTEYLCFNQRAYISTVNGRSLKLVDKFTYLESSISSTEKDINTRLAKAWTANGSLSVIWKSDLTDKIKRNFFPSNSSVDTAIWMDYMDTSKTYGEKAWRQIHKNAASNTEQFLEATPHKTAAIRPPSTYTKTIQVRRTRHVEHCWRSKDEL